MMIGLFGIIQRPFEFLWMKLIFQVHLELYAQQIRLIQFLRHQDIQLLGHLIFHI